MYVKHWNLMIYLSFYIIYDVFGETKAQVQDVEPVVCPLIADGSAVWSLTTCCGPQVKV